ncbi:MAG: hypothetical protein NWE89_10255 [Candidatus Bathyarchaeota archaeon]|nr:hypothetical protein [Candidatus Bathyarchaeota archaeon]
MDDGLLLRMVGYKEELNNRLILWRIGAAVPLAGLTVQANNVLHGLQRPGRVSGEVLLGLIWVAFMVDYSRFVRNNNAISIYREYIDVKRKMN